MAGLSGDSSLCSLSVPCMWVDAWLGPESPACLYSVSGRKALVALPGCRAARPQVASPARSCWPYLLGVAQPLPRPLQSFLVGFIRHLCTCVASDRHDHCSSGLRSRARGSFITMDSYFISFASFPCFSTRDYGISFTGLPGGSGTSCLQKADRKADYICCSAPFYKRDSRL